MTTPTTASSPPPTQDLEPADEFDPRIPVPGIFDRLYIHFSCQSTLYICLLLLTNFLGQMCCAFVSVLFVVHPNYLMSVTD